jgi:predicted amidophosphoribosyltransferase
VITTGATLEACAQVIIEAEAASVSVAVLAAAM